MAKGMLSEPPKKKAGGQAGKPQTFMSAGQNKLVNQTRKADTQIGKQANRGFRRAAREMRQPFDFSQFEAQRPQGPDFSNIAAQFNPQDWNAYRQEQIAAANEEFDRQFAKDFAQEGDDFEQQMYNRGIPVGSELYNKEKTRLESRQDDARRSNAYAAMNQGMANATGFGQMAMGARTSDINNQGNIYAGQLGAYNSNVANALNQRYQPLNEANMMRAAQSPLMMQDAQFGNNMALGNQQGQFALAAKRAGGGGGGGADWQQNGFGSYQDYAAFQDARALNMARQQQAMQGGGPSPWASFLGNAAGAIGYGLFNG